MLYLQNDVYSIEVIHDLIVSSRPPGILVAILVRRDTVSMPVMIHWLECCYILHFKIFFMGVFLFARLLLSEDNQLID